MTTLPEPPDLEPGEDRIVELASVIPPADEAFAEAVQARIDREALATNLTTLAWSGLVDGCLQLLNALMSFVGAQPSNDENPAEDDHE